MKINVLAIGKMRGGPERAVFDHYWSRLTWPKSLKEMEETGKRPPRDLKRREGALLLGAAPKGAVVCALDEKGRDLTSRQLAERIGRWRDDGARDIAFMIGGADGLDDAVKDRADLLLSFGRATWPHMLVRGMLAEQLYRAQCILAGHPYHRD